MFRIRRRSFSVEHKVAKIITFGNGMRSSELGIDPVQDDRIAGQVVITTEFGHFRAPKRCGAGDVRALVQNDRQFVFLIFYLFRSKEIIISLEHRYVVLN